MLAATISDLYSNFQLPVGVGGGGGGGGRVGRIGQWSEGAIALLRPSKFLNSGYQ